mmetsp:Transcript_7991/g.19478  ORF Transcript_7991/g.19478 Transcript_7991/m.19478 type:complete len:266 (-) Transcript_7991:1030-1827(-)
MNLSVSAIGLASWVSIARRSEPSSSSSRTKKVCTSVRQYMSDVICTMNPRRGRRAVGNGETQFSLKRLNTASVPESPAGPRGTTEPGGKIRPPLRSNQKVVATPAARAESGATVRVSADVYVDQTAREIWRECSDCSHPHSNVSAIGHPHPHVTLIGHEHSQTTGTHAQLHSRNSHAHAEQFDTPSAAKGATPWPEHEQLSHWPTAWKSGEMVAPAAEHAHSVSLPASFGQSPAGVYSVGGRVTAPVEWSHEHPTELAEQLKCSS